MPDPSPFLSTIAATSAAMVAIVGGLLVARFVTIASEQEGAQGLLDDAQGRLATARRRKDTAEDALRNWDIRSFFGSKVIRAICDGEKDVPTLRIKGGSTLLTDDEISKTVEAVEAEFERACLFLEQAISPDTQNSNKYPKWRDAKYIIPSLPHADWDEVWNIAYEGIVRPPQPERRTLSGITSAPFIIEPSPPLELLAVDIRRRGDLQMDAANAKQHSEDIEEELGRLQRTRNAIVRPKGLGWGLVVLGFFTFVGVIIPIWLMSRAPKRLTAHFGEVVFWLFFAGLLSLLGYMTVLALRLSGWRKNKKSDDKEQEAPNA